MRRKCNIRDQKARGVEAARKRRGRTRSIPDGNKVEKREEGVREMAVDGTVRNYFGKARVERGSMGVGYVVLAEEPGLGEVPIASVHVPMRDARTSERVARFFAECWNEGRA